MGRGRKKTSNKSTPFLNLKGLKTKSYAPEDYENVNPNDLSDDEIDAFIKANEDEISLHGTGYGSDDDENRGLSYDNDLVLGLNGDDSDNSEDDEEAAGGADNAEGEEGEYETLEESLEHQKIGGWGHNKASYYEEHSSARSAAYTPSEASRNEELEARRLQRAHNNAIDEEDFVGSLRAEDFMGQESEKKGNFTVEREMVEEMNRDLNEISIFGGDGGAERIEKRLDKLSKEEKMEIIRQNSPELIALIGEFKSSLESIKKNYDPAVKLIQKLDESDLESEAMVDFCNFVKDKSVKDHPVIEELVRIRTLFEKLKPVEAKFGSKLRKLFKNISDPSFSLSSLFTASTGEKDTNSAEEDIEEEFGENEDLNLDLGFDLKEMVSSSSSSSKKTAAKKPSIKSFVAKKYKNPSLSLSGKKSSAKLVDETGEHEEYYANSDDEQGTFSSEKKKTITQTINDIAQVAHESGQLRKKRMISGDQDELPQKGKENKKRKIEVPEYSKVGLQEDKEEEERKRKEEEEKRKKEENSIRNKERREKERIAKGLEILEADYLAEGAKRDISRRIEKNKGLIRPRSTAHGTTPHSRVRAKFQKKLRSGSGVMPAKRDRSKPFTGEKNGIKPHVVHSTKF